MKQKIFYLLSAVAFMGLVSCKGGETPSSSQEQEVSSEIQGVTEIPVANLEMVTP